MRRYPSPLAAALIRLSCQRQFDLSRPLKIALMLLAIPLALGVLILAACLYGGTIVYNSSHSLKGDLFVLFERPRIMARGMIAQAHPPRAYASRFEDVAYLKRIAGLGGDLVSRDGATICIRERCVYAADTASGTPFDALIPGGVIPQGYVALLGDAPDSLDSRYKSVGLWPIADIIATGFTIPGVLLPEWEGGHG